MNQTNPLSVEQLAGLARRRGRNYWKGLEELAQTPEFQARLADEFPASASQWSGGFSRRRFLQVMGASLALGGLTGCVKSPQEKIVPYVQQPELLTPGKPLYYSTAFVLGGFARGIVVEQHEGRPTKIEGNPDHPASLGHTDAITQASILGLYDPDRSKVFSCEGDVTTWSRFAYVMANEMQAKRNQKGKGLVLLTETVTSPTLAAQIRSLLAELPLAAWHQFDAVGRDNVRQGAKLAFGAQRNVLYDFSKATVIVSLDSNFLIDDPGSVRYAKDFFGARRVKPDAPTPHTMNRLYVAEGTPSTTGSMADCRLPISGPDIAKLATVLAGHLGLDGGASRFGDLDLKATLEMTGNMDATHWLDAAARDLKAAGSGGLVLVGESQPPEVHALAHAINAQLKSAAAMTSDPIEAEPVVGIDSLRDLVGKMHSGDVDMLVIFGGNPGYAAPSDLDFAGAMGKVRLRIRVGLYEDETSQLCHWQVPQSHPLEAWSDTRAYDGTVTIVQPLIAPLYNSKSDHEILSVLAGGPEKGGHEIVRTYWNGQHSGDFETWWRTALEKGLIADSALPTSPAATISANVFRAMTQTTLARQVATLTLCFRPDPCVWDGQFANNGWLQELPKPLTKLTWDNAAMISPTLAGKLGVWNNDLVAITAAGKTVNLPVWVQPGQPSDTVTVHLGYGRRHTGSVGTGTGVDVYPLRSSSNPWYTRIEKIEKIDGTYTLAATHTHQTMADRSLPGVPADITPEVVKESGAHETAEKELSNRNLIRTATLDQFNADPNSAIRSMDEKGVSLSLYPGDPNNVYDKNYKWAMSIDLTSCMGCNACVVACQSENNIPVVGKEQVLAQREMHWIRIDTYYTGELDAPETYHQPVPCMHCENAPCEVVCPVAATVHDNEGINNMVYNRCVGTRYCQNNCPYKVRRFNFFNFADARPSIKMQKNPNVTVRSRGVMEKCTYCIQRITSTRLEIEKTQVRLEAAGAPHNEVVKQMQDMLDSLQTACQQACPAEAIVFGNINTATQPMAGTKSHVLLLQNSPLNYGILTDLNTKPRTTYMARLRNPPPLGDATTAPEKPA